MTDTPAMKGRYGAPIFVACGFNDEPDECRKEW